MGKHEKKAIDLIKRNDSDVCFIHTEGFIVNLCGLLDSGVSDAVCTEYVEAYSKFDSNGMDAGTDYSNTVLCFEKSEITMDDSDIDLAIDDILERYCEWNKVDRAAAEKDQAVIDFEGKIDGEGFEGNESKDFKLVIGSKSMIPGFEDNLIGKKSGDSFSFKTNFPEDYFKNDLAGKETEFFITVHEVQEMHKAKIDKELFEKLAMENQSVYSQWFSVYLVSYSDCMMPFR